MSERIDHAAEAMKWVAGQSHMSAEALMNAQVHATLALVEQQRIANLIAIAAIELDLDKDEPEAVKAMYDKGALRPEIREALGIRE